MKKVFIAILVVMLSMILAACGQRPIGTTKTETSIRQEQTEITESETLTWQEQYDLGVSYLSEGNYEASIIAFTDVIEAEPNRAEAYIGRAKAYLLSGETEENLTLALADYKTVTTLDETNVDAWLEISNILVTRGEAAQALIALQQASEKTNGNEKITDKLSDIFGKTYVDSLLEIASDSLAYMFTNGWNPKYSSDSVVGGYSYDINGDGVKDWILGLDGEPSADWVFCISDDSGFNCHYWEGAWNAGTAFYVSDIDNRLVITIGKSSAMYSYTEHTVYENGEFRSLSEELADINITEQGETSWVYNYTVHGKEATEDEYKAVLASVGNLTRLDYITAFQVEYQTDIDCGLLRYATDVIKNLSFAESAHEKDINNDGILDNVVFLGLDPNEGPKGVISKYTAESEDFKDKFAGVWTDCCIVLMSDNDRVKIEICSTYDGLNYINDPAKYAAIPNDIPQDGTYYTEIHYSDTIDTNKFLEFDLLEYVELSDDVISSVKTGDVIQLPDSNFKVRSIERSSDSISFNNGEHRCLYIEETDSWRFVWPSDMAYTYVAGQYTLPVSEAASFFDYYTPFSSGQNVYEQEYNGEVGDDTEFFKLVSLNDYFDFHNYLNSEYATVTVDNGQITEIVINYRPK